MEHEPGFLINGWHSVVFLLVWLAVVLVYGVARSLGGAPQDPMRPSGPLD